MIELVSEMEIIYIYQNTKRENILSYNPYVLLNLHLKSMSVYLQNQCSFHYFSTGITFYVLLRLLLTYYGKQTHIKKKIKHLFAYDFCEILQEKSKIKHLLWHQ